MKTNKYKAIVIGGSAGSMEVLLKFFHVLPKTFRVPIIIACHLHPLDNGGLVEFFKLQTNLRIKEAEDKEQIRSGYIYFSPANYHLLIEQDNTFSLSVDPRVNYARPSIDVLFESAAVAWADELIGIILTGANSDGTAGICAIKLNQGLTIAQDPSDSAYPVMPQAAIDTGKIDIILCVDELDMVLQYIGLDIKTKGSHNAG